MIDRFPDPVHVFCGLSVSHAQAKSLIARSAVIHAPIKRGDIPAVVDSSPGAGTIAVIDGVFHSQETMTLMEIRSAISKGWALIGCSSMGALRALEAEPLGMRGHGLVYRWLRLFRVEDDDEVAQIMNPDTFTALSLAMVDIRWHVSVLRKKKILSRDQARKILADIKSRYYPHRTRRLLSDLVSQQTCSSFSLGPDENAPKRRDALQLMRRLGRGSA